MLRPHAWFESRLVLLTGIVTGEKHCSPSLVFCLATELIHVALFPGCQEVMEMMAKGIPPAIHKDICNMSVITKKDKFYCVYPLMKS